MKKSKAHLRAVQNVQTLANQMKESNLAMHHLLDQRDGLKMQVDAHLAKVNGQGRLIDQLKKERAVAVAKAQAYKEITEDLISQLRELAPRAEMHFQADEDGDWKNTHDSSKPLS
jgi:hypothetical protein